MGDQRSSFFLGGMAIFRKKTWGGWQCSEKNMGGEGMAMFRKKKLGELMMTAVETCSSRKSTLCLVMFTNLVSNLAIPRWATTLWQSMAGHDHPHVLLLGRIRLITILLLLLMVLKILFLLLFDIITMDNLSDQPCLVYIAVTSVLLPDVTCTPNFKHRPTMCL